MADGFGKFDVLCRTVPSYPQCNLFVRQLVDSGLIQYESLESAGMGVNPDCSIPRLLNGQLGNIANIITCGVSVFVVAVLILFVHRRQAAVGRVEFRALLFIYLLTLPLQLLTTGSIFRQATDHLVVLTAIHLGLVAAFFWTLLANGLISLQLVEDGTLPSLIPFYFFTFAFFAATTYVSLDTAFTWTSTFGPSNPPQVLKNIPLFALTSIWPLASAFIFLVITTYVVTVSLEEYWPMVYFVGSAVAFVLSQLDYFLLSKIICKAAKSKIDGSFIATFLETASIVLLFFGWKSITEDSWDDAYNYYPQ